MRPVTVEFGRMQKKKSPHITSFEPPLCKPCRPVESELITMVMSLDVAEIDPVDRNDFLGPFLGGDGVRIEKIIRPNEWVNLHAELQINPLKTILKGSFGQNSVTRELHKWLKRSRL